MSRNARPSPLQNIRPTLESLEDRLSPAITFSPASLPSVTVGDTTFSQQVTATGGTGPYTYTMGDNALNVLNNSHQWPNIASVLPHGLTLSGNGLLSSNGNSITEPGTYSVMITATDSTGAVGRIAYPLTVNPLITLGSLPTSGATGVLYNNTAGGATITATGGTGPYAFGLIGGQLPTGLTLSPAGVLSGTPLFWGDYPFVVSATDANGNTGDQTYLLSITSPLSFDIGPTQNEAVPAPILPQSSGYYYAVSGIEYQMPISNANSNTYQFEIDSGNLPVDATLTPIAGYQNFTATTTISSAILTNVSNVSGLTLLQVVTGAGVPAGTTITQIDPVAKTITLSAQATASGQAAFSAAGTFGTGFLGDTTQGSTTITNIPVALAYGLAIGQGITGTGIPNNTTIVDFDYDSGTNTYSVTLSNAATAAGTNVSFLVTTYTLSTLLRFVPASGTTYDFTVKGTDILGNDTSGNPLSYTVYSQDVSATQYYGLNYGLPLATVGQSYNQAIVANGATSLTASVASLHGLTISTSNNVLTISGTPQTADATTNGNMAEFYVTATYDVGGTPYTSWQYFNINVNPAAESIAILGPAQDGSLPPATTDSTTYTAQLTSNITGGAGSPVIHYSYPASGNQPAWLTLSTSGLFSIDGSAGKVTSKPGVYNVIVLAKDTQTGYTTSRVFQLTVDPPAGAPQLALSSGTPSLPLASPGIPYNVTISAPSGFTLTHTTVGGPMPPGLSFSLSADQSGLTISGTPTIYPWSANVSGDPTTIVVTVSSGSTEVSSQSFILGNLYTPAQIRQAYGIDKILLDGGVIGDGTGITVGVINYDGDIPNMVSSTDPNYQYSDMAVFSNLMGLKQFGSDPATGPVFLKVDDYGGTNYPAPSGDNSEATQDVEWIHALAPGANIILFEINTSDFTAFQTARTFQPVINGTPLPLASVFSSSFGDDHEQSETFPPGSIYYRRFFQAPNGTTFFFTAGDAYFTNDAHMVSARSAFGVPIVGYSQLTLDAAGNYGSEAAVDGSGGGSSLYAGQQPWQQGVVAGTRQSSPDVTFNGTINSSNAVYDSYSWQYVNTNFDTAALNYDWDFGNGTSIAAPSWAGVYAIVNQARLSAGLPLLNSSETLAALYGAPSEDFNQVNQLDDGAQLSGFTRYNPWAGLGSPIANLLIPDLAGGKNTISGTVLQGVTSGTGIANVTVFLDANGNGVLDSGEFSTITDANGNYQFIVAPGTFPVAVVSPQGYHHTTPTHVSAALPIGSSPAVVNFGFLSAPLVVGADAGAAPQVSVFNADGSLRFSFFAYAPGFLGGVRVAVGDVNGDGVADVITGAGANGNGHVKVFDGATAAELHSFLAYPGYAGAIFVAAGDVDGDERADIVTGTDAGVAPHVKVFGAAGELWSFYAYDAGFTGGVRVAASDVNGDGKADIVTGAGPGAGPHAKVFDAANLNVLRSFMAFAPAFQGGIYVAVGDTNGDSTLDLVVGAGGADPNVKVIDGRNGDTLWSFFAYAEAFAGGVRVGTYDLDGDGRAELLTGPGPGGPPQTQVLDASTKSLLDSFFAFDEAFLGGVFVAGG